MPVRKRKRSTGTPACGPVPAPRIFGLVRKRTVPCTDVDAKSRKGSPHPLRSNCQSMPPGAETRHYIPSLDSEDTFCVDVCTMNDYTLYNGGLYPVESPTVPSLMVDCTLYNGRLYPVESLTVPCTMGDCTLLNRRLYPIESRKRIFPRAEFAKNSDREAYPDRKILHLPLQGAPRFPVAEFAKNSDPLRRPGKRLNFTFRKKSPPGLVPVELRSCQNPPSQHTPPPSGSPRWSDVANRRRPTRGKHRSTGINPVVANWKESPLTMNLVPRGQAPVATWNAKRSAKQKIPTRHASVRKISHLPLQGASRFPVAEFAKNSDREAKPDRKILHLPLQGASRSPVAEFAKNSDREAKPDRKILHLPLQGASRSPVAEFAKNSDREAKPDRKISHLPLQGASRSPVAEFAKNSDPLHRPGKRLNFASRKKSPPGLVPVELRSCQNPPSQHTPPPSGSPRWSDVAHRRRPTRGKHRSTGINPVVANWKESPLTMNLVPRGQAPVATCNAKRSAKQKIPTAKPNQIGRFRIFRYRVLRDFSLPSRHSFLPIDRPFRIATRRVTNFTPQKTPKIPQKSGLKG